MSDNQPARGPQDDSAPASRRRGRRLRRLGVLGAVAMTGAVVPVLPAHAASGDIDAYAGSRVDGPVAATSVAQVPFGLVLDSTDKLYVSAGTVVRKIDTAATPQETVVAGTGFKALSGDGADAKLAQVSGTLGMDRDATGNLYIADSGNDRIRKVDTAATPVISTFAPGFTGFSGPSDVAVNGTSFYVADTGKHHVQKIDTTTSPATVTTVVGSPTAPTACPQPTDACGDAGAATSAQLNRPSGLAINGTDLYIADKLDNRIRLVDLSLATPTITTVAGIGTAGYSGDCIAPVTTCPPTQAQLNGPFDLAVTSTGDLYIADTSNHRIRKVSAGKITTVAGDGSACAWSIDACGDGAAATSAQLNAPYTVARDGSGNLYIADNGNRKVRKVNTAGVITTYAGNGTGTSADGTPGYRNNVAPASAFAEAQMNYPEGLQLSSGSLYFADRFNNRVRKIDTTAATPTVSDVAGTGKFPATGLTGCRTTADPCGDGGAATSAVLNDPQGVAVDGTTVYIADTSNHRIRKVDSSGNISTLAGTGVACPAASLPCGDGAAATLGQLNLPYGLAAGGGYLYIADFSDRKVRRVKLSDGVISTCADFNNPVTPANAGNPIGVTLDGTDLYIADQARHVIRKLDVSSGSCAASTIVAGTDGAPCSPSTAACGTGLATSANLNIPFAVAVRHPTVSTTELYISDQGDNRIRKVVDTSSTITASATISTYAGTGTAGYSGDGAAATSAKLRAPRGVALDGSGNLYIADTSNHRIRKVSA